MVPCINISIHTLDCCIFCGDIRVPNRVLRSPRDRKEAGNEGALIHKLLLPSELNIDQLSTRM